MFNNSPRYDGGYIKTVLKDKLNALPYHVFLVGNDKVMEYKTYQEALKVVEKKFPEATEQDLEKIIIRKFKTLRYSYPKRFDDGNLKSIQTVKVDSALRPYCFKREDFVSEKEEVEFEEKNLSYSAVNGNGDIEVKDLPF